MIEHNYKLIQTKIKDFITTNWLNIIFILAVIIVTIFYLNGVPGVPFHPDESSYLFMSSDLDTLFNNPSELYWVAGKNKDLRQHYREIDPPLFRDAIGIGRHIASLPALPVDWDWSKTWEENLQAGALPDSSLLLTGRMVSAIFFPFSLILIYLIGKTIGNRFTGWCAAFLLASNSLVLIHTRRAMSEGILVCAILFAVWVILKFYHSAWLVGIATALAGNAKQSALVLLLPGLVSTVWLTPDHYRRKLDIIIKIGIVGISFAITFFILNPFMWSNPILANISAMKSRLELVNNQVADINKIRPDLVLNSPIDRFAGMVIQLFFTPPAIADVGNYLEQTRAAETAYLANPLHQLFRGMVGGSIFFILTLFGFIAGILQMIRNKSAPDRHIILLWIAGICQFLFLGFIIPLPYQRYYIPMVPFTCLWMAYGISLMTSKLRFRKEKLQLK